MYLRWAERSGYEEKAEDGSVRIFAEAEEGVLNEFITKLKMKNHLIDVRDVSVSFEDATGEFSAFKKVISGTMYEVAERLDDAADILEKLTGAVIHGNEKIIGTIERGNKEVISTIDRGNAMLAEKIDAGRAENREGFGVLAEKIDSIKEDTGEIKDTLSFLKVIHQELENDTCSIDCGKSQIPSIKSEINTLYIFSSRWQSAVLTT